MTNLRGTIRQALLEARRRQAMTEDERRTERALRLEPNAEWLYTRVATGLERDYLLAMGWEVVSAVPYHPVGGTSLFTETLLRKKNPTSTTIAP